MQNIRVAFRQFRRSPALVITIVLTLALGIGANTAIFTLVHAVLMKSLPVVDPKTLYRVGDKDDCCVNSGFMNDNGDFDLFSNELYRHIRDTTPEFEQVAAMQSGSNTMTVRRDSEPAKALRSQYVSGNFFSTFGIRPFAGRVLSQADDTPGAAPAVVMSYQAWRADYAGDPSVVGATFYIQNQPVTVVGISPPGFFGDRIRSKPPALWIPLSAEPLIERENALIHVPEANWLDLIGRVKPDVSIGPLQARISNTLRLWLASQTAYTQNGGSKVIPRQHVVITPGGGGIQMLQQETSKGLYLLMTLSGLVLLVACANVANLLLARGATRKAETSIRMALGAARGRLIRQMLMESVLLGCLGWPRRTGGRVRGHADDPGAGLPQLAATADRRQPVAAGAGIRVPAVPGDRGRVRERAGMDCLALRSGRGAARREPLDARPHFAAAEVADRVSGRAVADLAGGRRTADQKPAQSGTSGLWPPDLEPLRAAH